MNILIEKNRLGVYRIASKLSLAVSCVIPDIAMRSSNDSPMGDAADSTIALSAF